MTFNPQPTLENHLILIRPLKPADLESLYHAANDPLIWDQHPAKRYKREVFEGFFAESLASGGALVIIDKSTGEIIGSSRYQKAEGVENAIEIGWSFLARKYWGGKYNREFKSLMIDHALESLEHVVFHVARENIRSQKAMEKIGGILVVEPDLAYLLKRPEENVTYRISTPNSI